MTSVAAPVLAPVLAILALANVASSTTAPNDNLHPAFDIEDFSQRDVRFVGNAGHAGKALRLTRAKNFRSGAAWFPEKQPVANGFRTAFQFQLRKAGGDGGGADGLAFVLQSAGANAIAGNGEAGGFNVGDGWGNLNKPGIARSIAVFFDTFRNENRNDPSDNYVSICTGGTPAQLHWPPERIAFTPELRVKLKDGAVHRVEIAYQPPVLTVLLDDERVLSSPVDLSTVVDSDGEAFVGFTASTGGGYEEHNVLNWSFAAGPRTHVSSAISYLMSECLPGKSLCTPDRVTVDEISPGTFHVVLPANRPWDASISNASSQEIVLKNAIGKVCLTTEAVEPHCSGPEAGMLIWRTQAGRTQFSINAEKGASLKDAEGYFEFDVELPGRSEPH